MKKYHNNPLLQYILVLCLGFALVLSQTNRLHMHLQHNHHLSVASAHSVDIHTASTLHDFDLSNNLDDHHHSVAIDISPDNLVKKINSLNPLLLFLFFIGLFLYIPRLVYQLRQRLTKTLFTSCYYFLHPPLRAPPVK